MYDADGEPQPVQSAKGRALLAALLLEPGRVVSVEALKDALWGGAPPASAHASLQNHVTRLRRLLDDPERLRAVPPGYRLRVDDGELDVRVFEQLVARARAAHGERDWHGCVDAASAALALWRGTPLDGMPADSAGHALVPRLEEARLLALELRYDAELATGGGGGGLVPELAELVAEYPLREAFHGQLMLVLHRSGRQAEALAVHRELRRRLVDELGVEPGAAVRAAHGVVLREVAGVGFAGGSGAAGAASGAGAGAGVDAEAGADVGFAAGHRSRSGAGAGVDAAPGAGVDAGPGSVADPAPSSVPRPAANPDAARPAPAPSVDASHASTPAPAPTRTRTRPAQLPPAPAHFTGRAPVVRSLATLLAGQAAGSEGGSDGGRGVPAPASHGTTDPSPPIAVLSGMAGVGKSALALHVAHRLREHFPDGQLYVNLRGATPGMTPLSPEQALAALLRDLGVEPSHSPEHPDAAAALLRSLLAPTRTLLVLDDAATAAQVRPLLPAGSGCAVIVTSRSTLTALDGAGRFPLEPLSGGDSAALLRAVSGRAGLDAGHPLVELAGRLPLALRIIAARLAARRALTPEALAELLTVSGGRLHHLEYDDLSVRRSLAVALDALRTSERESDRDAAAALAVIGALDLPAYGIPLVARLLAVEEWRAGAALDRLVDVALLDETAYARYAPHDLVRDFAREVARQDCTRAAVDVVETALHWYAESARQTLLAIMPEGLDRDDRLRGVAERLDRPAAPTTPAPAMSTEEAFAWGDTELANVIALADRHGRDSVLLPVLVRCFFSYLKRRGRLTEADLLNHLAVTAARRWNDTAAEAQALTDLAGLNYVSGRSDRALELIDEALALWRELDHMSCVHRGVINRGLLLEALGRYEESAEALRHSLELAKALGDPLSEAFALSTLGNVYEHTDARAAISYYERSLAIGEALGHAGLRQEVHCDMGKAYLALGEPAVALTHFEESLRIHGVAEDWHNESKVRLGMVRALRGVSRTQEATRECVDLLERAEQRADAHTAGLARHQRGLLLYAEGRTEEAYAHWKSALESLEGTDSSEVVGELRNLLAG
ncbi:BTAD domain-containing putative transcriptional regulator [Streptomyces sp. NPDC048436]|uniref:AfsR/SARP family transcriptional regulator n=1 Tax=Streptomyces sp. NPDC048436 TaxID=3365550 RepID=UPI00371CB85D